MILKVVAASLVLALTATGAARAASIIDGDFSSPNEHGGWGDTTTLPGWVSDTPDSFEVGNSAVYGLPCVSAGCQNLEVNANQLGSVSQTVTGLTVGDTYTLSWLYGGRNAGGPQQLDVFANSTQIATDSSDGVTPSWTPNTFKFLAGATSEEFTFTSVNEGGDPTYGNELTNVALTVPEPATWVMMLMGVGMIGAGMRLLRRRNDVALPTT
jgi:hypothetical protein